MYKDIGNYLYDIQFCHEVYDGVLWVPLNTLGKTRYTNEEMREIAALPPREKRERIHNLYEAVQLFQVSDFKGVFDNKDFWIDGIHWQTHKTPEEAVETGEGCCATGTNWLSYFISDKYDFVGCFGCGNADGNGHVTTYIRQQDMYYFIDMMMCRKDSIPHFCKEDASLAQWRESEWAGFLYACKDPVQMCHFTIDRLRAKGRDVPYHFCLKETNAVTATGCDVREDGTTVFFNPPCDRPKLIYLEENTKHKFVIADFPLQG